MTTKIAPTIRDKWTKPRRRSRGSRGCGYNPETETVEQKEVTAVFVREIDHINYRTIEDEQGNDLFTKLNRQSIQN